MKTTKRTQNTNYEVWKVERRRSAREMFSIVSITGQRIAEVFDRPIAKQIVKEHNLLMLCAKISLK